jgi:hypothetical protein
MPRKVTTEEFINRAKEKHGEKYQYPEGITICNGLHKQVKILCKIHGEFSQRANDHLRGNGCQKCAKISMANKLRSNTNDFIIKAKQVHGDLYDYTDTKYVDNSTKVTIKCIKHGPFGQTPNNHLDGSGCPKCVGKNKTTEDFIDEAKQVHGDRYDYKETKYCDNKTDIIIICKVHGKFPQTPSNHLNGNGCPTCAIITRADKQRSNIEEFIEDAKKVHGERYEYPTKDNIYVNIDTPLIIICKDHGKFLQSPYCHLKGQNCPKCAKISMANKQRSNINEFREKAKQVHGALYDYTDTKYERYHEKVTIKCALHGLFKQRPSDHLRGQGCPGCNNRGYSKTQIEWLNFISKRDGITIIHAENEGEFAIPNTRFKADGYCIETNTVYEFHGDYWHGNPNVFDSNEFNKTTKCTFGELYQKTLDKEQQIKDMGFNLVTMWENDWDELNNCVIMLQRIYRNSKRTHKPT